MATLLSLPVELQYQILAFLSSNDQILAGMVCTLWHQILLDQRQFRKKRYTRVETCHVETHRLVESSKGHMRCTMRGGEIIKYTLFYWKDHNQREPMKFDITNCPFLDEPLFTEAPPVQKPETGECGDHGSGGVARKVEKRMKFRIGAVACKPILRGFFWDGGKQEKEDDITVRQAVEEIARNLKREIESSKLLSDLGLASGQRKIKFRPIGRWTLADNPGKGMDAVRENISVSETSVRFKERSLQYGVATRGRFY